MSLYDLPKIELPKIKISKIKIPRFWRNRFFLIVVLTVLISSFFGFLAGTVSGIYFFNEVKDYLSKLNIEIPEPQIVEKIIEKETMKEYLPQTTQEEKIIQVVENVSPVVVSIVVTKDVKVLEEYWTFPFEEFPFQTPE